MRTRLSGSAIGFLLSLGMFLSICPSTQGSGSCPLCGGVNGRRSLAQEINQARMVLYGTMTNAQLGANGAGQTDLQIEAIIKKHEFLGDRKTLTIPRFLPPAGANQKWLVYCDVFKGQVDPYLCIAVQANADMPKYLQAASAVVDKPVEERLRFAFQYLDNAEPEISFDAFNEFATADYKHVRAMAADLPADKIAKWLKDANTPRFRYGLYGLLLGHCGKEKHASCLRDLIGNPATQTASGIDGILAGLVLIQPPEGWKKLQALLADPKQDFMLRYAVLRTVQFFWDYRPDVVEQKALVRGIAPLLDQSDIADLAIEDLRKWKQWDVCGTVLELRNRKSHDIPIIRRSILRYALSCPDPKAAAFVAEYRKRDPEIVKDTEELLDLDSIGKE